METTDERLKEIVDTAKKPSELVPRVVTMLFIELGAIYAEKHDALSIASIEHAELMAHHISDEMSQNKAKALADASDAGKRRIRLMAQLKGIEELLRAFKKAQQFYENEARNLY